MSRYLIVAALSVYWPMAAQAQFSDWQAAEESGAIEREAPDEGVDLGSGVDARRRNNELGRFWIENAFFYRSGDMADVIGESPGIGVEVRPIPALLIAAWFGIPGAIVTPQMGDSESSFGAGNPFVGAYWVGGTGQGVYVGWRVGGGVAIPVASSPDLGRCMTPCAAGLVELEAIRLASAMRGSRDAWYWAPERFGLVLPSGRITLQQRSFEAAFGLDVGSMLYTGDGDADTVILVQLVGEGGYRPSEDVTTGVRLTGVYGASGVTGDKFQSALDLFIRGRTDSAFLELDFSMNLDDPSGFAFDDDGVWGLTLRLGAYL